MATYLTPSCSSGSGWWPWPCCCSPPRWSLIAGGAWGSGCPPDLTASFQQLAHRYALSTTF
jgi:hypothetical protein